MYSRMKILRSIRDFWHKCWIENIEWYSVWICLKINRLVMYLDNGKGMCLTRSFRETTSLLQYVDSRYPMAHLLQYA